MVEASVTGLFRTILILIGVFTLLRFLGRILVAKRNLASEKEMRRREEEKNFTRKNAKSKLGRVEVHQGSIQPDKKEKIIDIPFEEVNE